MPVTDARGRVVGVISTTDILWALAEATESRTREQLVDKTPVRELMTARSRVVAPDADVLEAAREMLYLDVDRLFVEDEGRLVGVISQTDIVARRGRSDRQDLSPPSRGNDQGRNGS